MSGVQGPLIFPLYHYYRAGSSKGLVQCLVVSWDLGGGRSECPHVPSSKLLKWDSIVGYNI